MTTHTRRRKRADRWFAGLCLLAATVGVAVLLLVIGKIVMDGASRLDLSFITTDLSSRAKKTGVWGALIGTLWISVLTTLIAVPVGVAAAVFLEEFTVKKNRVTRFIQLNIANLAGVPSIVYGLLGLAVFVRGAQLGYSVIAGALTMALLVLPTVIVVSQEALKAVPNAYREASLGLGATRWQAIRHQVLPAAIPGIATGVILSLSRAAGETAPLIVVGALFGPQDAPGALSDKYTVMPMQIFNWSQDSREEFHTVAAAAIIVLVAGLLALNSVAIILRNRMAQRR